MGRVFSFYASGPGSNPARSISFFPTPFWLAVKIYRTSHNTVYDKLIVFSLGIQKQFLTVSSIVNIVFENRIRIQNMFALVLYQKKA